MLKPKHICMVRYRNLKIKSSCILKNDNSNDIELNVEVIKNVDGFFDVKKNLKKIKVKYACRLCKSEDKTEQ
jgi:hypothetical protein